MVKDLAGMRFGHLTVVKLAHCHGGQAHWLCSCDCGKDTVVRSSRLRNGQTSSCGCKKGHITHHESKTRLYHIWRNMLDRCLNPKNPQYESYGARGIVVCDEWFEYVPFRNWALANGYSKELSIDRINNDGGYCPENCRWTTALQQANNTRKTRFITYNGETHSVSEWARILNIKQSTLSMRINKYGWSVEKALGKEIKKYVS